VAARCLHAAALGDDARGDARGALRREKAAYALYKRAFGAANPRVLESARYMDHFTARAVSACKRAVHTRQRIAALGSAAAQQQRAAAAKAAAKAAKGAEAPEGGPESPSKKKKKKKKKKKGRR